MTHRLAFALAVAFALPVGAQAHRPAPAPVRPALLGGVAFGYNSGRAVDAQVTVANVLPRSTFGVRLALRYASVDPGLPGAARQVFINDATNGTPEKHGHTWGLKFDLMHPVHLLGIPNAWAYAGVRHARFLGNFRFVGGNEDFDVRSSHWGLGGGLESRYAVSPRVSLALGGGVDYFFPGRMYGHDTAYSPNGDNENPRQGYSYSDADKAIGQPKLSPVLNLGLDYHF